MYTHILTPKGIEEKVSVPYRFFRRKMADYDSISAEIERLARELAESGLLDAENGAAGVEANAFEISGRKCQVAR